MILILGLGLLLLCAVAAVAALIFMLLATFRAKTFGSLLLFLAAAGVALFVLALAFTPLWVEIIGQINVNFGGGRPERPSWLPVILGYIGWALILLIRLRIKKDNLKPPDVR